MIHSVSLMIKHPQLKDYYKIIITRQEPEVNNNQVYQQEVSGSYKSVKWFRNAVVLKMNQQHNR